MTISFIQHDLPKDGQIVVFSFDQSALTSSAKVLNEKLSGALKRAMDKAEFKGKRGQKLILSQVGGYETVILIGLGAAEEITHARMQDTGAALFEAVDSARADDARVIIDEINNQTTVLAAHMAAGFVMRSYRFDKYKTKSGEDEPKRKPITSCTFSLRNASRAADHFKGLHAVCEGVALARDLVNEPPNILYPRTFMERAKELKKVGIKVTVLDQKQLEKLGFRALLAVAQGSVKEPYVVVMEYNGGPKSQKPVAFLGKGVTFDTGGINLKPTPGMEEMKFDMAGAATVVGAMHALAKRKAKVNVIGMIGLVENMPSGNAQRPSDIIKTLSGKTVEMLNTDAEGRLVLCDCIWYLQEKYKPATIIDFATLTGAILISLGVDIAGFFANDDQLAEQLHKAGELSGDRNWRMPLDELYDKLIESSIADFKTIGPREAGSITAAQYIGRFVKPGTKWAHVDIAGTAWAKKVRGPLVKGGTGYGVRLLDQWVRTVYE